MSFNLTIPQSEGTPLKLTLNIGDYLFVLGANGVGKSTIMHRFYTQHSANARRITAHRQTWFSTDTVTFSPKQRRDTEHNITNSDSNPESRWKDDYSAQRANIAIYDLVDAENVRARAIANAVDEDDITLAKELSKKDAPIKIINELLRLSNIPIEIAVRENEQVLACKFGGTPYSITQLSDGERNAILIAANILTVKPGTLILIDEPERHLHRSIISPLLTLLFAKRSDCAFIVSTHDVMIPLDNPEARTLLIRNCTFSNSTASAWEADLVSTEAEIDNDLDLKRDIFGARRKILFVEGAEQSLDKPLYSILFPNVTVTPKSSSRDVEHAVLGIRDAGAFHWLHAFGIVDNDGRTEDDINRLKSKGVYATPVFAVESIYYHPEVQRYVTERHVAVTGEDATTCLNEARIAAIEVIKPHIQRLSERASEKTVRENMLRNLPRRQEIAMSAPINVTIDIPSIVSSNRAVLQTALDSGELLDIIARYPIRETPALSMIAARLGFQNREQYEGAVRKLLMDDNEVLEFVRSLFGTLSTDMNAI